MSGRRQDGALRIGLVNNMPDAALVQTDRQFSSLLQTAAPGAVELVRLHFTATPRGAAAAEWLSGGSVSTEGLCDLDLDVLVVTGAEPKAADLTEEPYWSEFQTLADAAESRGLAVVWSCLAAHAAIRHLCGVGRRRLAAKESGVFAVQARADHALAADLPERWLTPHSRWNAVSETDLVQAGCAVLSDSARIGVDAFTLDAGGGFLFLQGHPEYDADTLAREFRRDVGRFAQGQPCRFPEPPEGVFTPEVVASLSRLASRAHTLKGRALTAACDAILKDQPLRADWRDSAVRLYGAWLHDLARRRRAAKWRRPAQSA